MADQDFNITIRTIADTTGIKLTEQGLNALKVSALQGNKEAIAAMKQLSAAQKEAAGASAGGFGGFGGFGGIGAGIATVASAFTIMLNRVKAFNDEEDKYFEKISEITRKNYELAQSILALKDAEISARRTATEPLADSYVRLQQELVKLKTEQNALDLPSQSKEWEDYQKQISAVTREIEGVKSELQKSGITDVTPKLAGPKAGKGESQALVDEMERNRKAAEEQLKEDVWEFDPETGGYRRSGQKRFPVFQPTPAPLSNPPPNENMIAEPIANATLERIAAGVETLLTLWR